MPVDCTKVSCKENAMNVTERLTNTDRLHETSVQRCSEPTCTKYKRDDIRQVTGGKCVGAIHREGTCLGVIVLDGEYPPADTPSIYHTDAVEKHLLTYRSSSSKETEDTPTVRCDLSVSAQVIQTI